MWKRQLNRTGSSARKQKSKRPPIFVYVMYLLVATVVFTGVTFSSYISTAMGQDTARVARFEVSGTESFAVSIPAEAMIPGDSFQQQFIIQNKGEVAVELSIAAEMMYNKLPLVLTVESVANELTQTLSALSEEQTYTLTVSWPSEQNDISWAGKTDVIRLTISAQQID